MLILQEKAIDVKFKACSHANCNYISYILQEKKTRLTKVVNYYTTVIKCNKSPAERNNFFPNQVQILQYTGNIL